MPEKTTTAFLAMASSLSITTLVRWMTMKELVLTRKPGGARGEGREARGSGIGDRAPEAVAGRPVAWPRSLGVPRRPAPLGPPSGGAVANTGHRHGCTYIVI
eukprot:scaffold102006_cov68-Phaeocystis_antarctica.AAC.4